MRQVEMFNMFGMPYAYQFSYFTIADYFYIQKTQDKNYPGFSNLNLHFNPINMKDQDIFIIACY